MEGTKGISPAPGGSRTALVLSGGGARGAYEAGVLAHIFEHVYPKLPPGFELDLLSGTSVGAIHAAYVAASSDMAPAERAKALLETWTEMHLNDVLRVSVGDLAAVPLRALGLGVLGRREPGGEGAEVLGGLVDISPLERLVARRVPWDRLSANLAAGRPGALCVACTEIQTGRVIVFMDGELAETEPWTHDPYVRARRETITPLHVRASAAIPFLFPADTIGDVYYLDGGLRVNTPLSPVLRLRADRVLVVGLKRELPPDSEPITTGAEAITQPAFLLGKVLNVLLLDQLENELRRLAVINALIDAASSTFGAGCLANINEAVQEKRGLEYRRVETAVVRPSVDIGKIAADAYERHGSAASRGLLPGILARMAMFGVPEGEADLLSYIYFDASFTRELVELGREDARAQEDEIITLLAHETT